MSTLAVVGAVAVAVSLASMIPQAVRVVRTRNLDGLSAGTVALTLATFACWATYGAGIVDWAQIWANAAGLVVFGLIAHFLAAGTPGLRAWWGPGIVAGTFAACILLALAASPAAAAWVGTGVGVLSRVPQVQVALSGTPLWGLDPWAVLLGLVTPLVWVGYGMAAGDVVVVASSVAGAALQAVIVARRLPLRRTALSLADGRLGPLVARVAAPVAQRLPVRDRWTADQVLPGVGA